MIEKTKPMIRVLDPHIANKIAAGEVIERPASVAKELIENAIDAGATRIDVYAEQGGSRLLRIVDDGCGMGPEDLRLAFLPHATSKLCDVEDLESVATLGFRGEALASIGAVSQAHILSRVRGEETGALVENHGGVITGPKAAGAAPGTEVVARNLFFNTPARAKFLRTVRTELGHLMDSVTRFALTFPEIAFKLVHDGTELLNLAAEETRPPRLGALLGRETGDSLMPVRARSPVGTLEGYIGPPSLNRATARDLHFFLNGRQIRDKILHRVVRDAYRDTLHHGRYPVVYLFLDVDPSQVDVNVHPTKAEVRWRDASFLHRVVGPALASALRECDHSVTPEVLRDRARAAVEDFVARAGETDASRPFATGSGGRTGSVAEGPAETPFSVFQVHDSYLVCEVEDGMAIVDQHALHERVQYDRILQRLTAGGVSAQRLLVPEEVEIPAADRGLLDEHAELLGRCGLEWSPFSDTSIALEAIPAVIPRQKAGDLLRDLIELLRARGTSVDSKTLFHDVADTMACKAAVRFGDRLSREEAAALLQESGALDHAFVCPHGRPTVMRLSFGALEKHFGRR